MSGSKTRAGNRAPAGSTHDPCCGWPDGPATLARRPFPSGRRRETNTETVDGGTGAAQDTIRGWFEQPDTSGRGTMSWRAVCWGIFASVGGWTAASAQAVDSAAAAVGVYRPVLPPDTATVDTARVDTARADTARADTAVSDSAALAKSTAIDMTRETVVDTSLTARMDVRRGGGLRRDEYPDLLSTAAMTGRFRTFLRLVNQTSLQGVLAGAGTFTLLVPTDSAFARLGAADLARLRNSTGLRNRWLATLVLDGSLRSKELVSAGRRRSRGGTLVQFSQRDGVIRAGPARLIEPDLVARNGILHGLDRVVLPNATSTSP
jgi:uncharacterized surface protein with fasciclin (FAS1) repeats